MEKTFELIPTKKLNKKVCIRSRIESKDKLIIKVEEWIHYNLDLTQDYYLL